MMEAAAGDYRVVGQPGYKVIVRSLDDMRALYGAVDAIGLGVAVREQMRRAMEQADGADVASMTLDPAKLRVFQAAEAALRRFSAPDGLTTIERTATQFDAVLARLDGVCADMADRSIAGLLTRRVRRDVGTKSGPVVVFVDRAMLRLFNRAEILNPVADGDDPGAGELVADDFATAVQVTEKAADARLGEEIAMAVAQAKNDRDVAYLASLSKIARNGDLDDLTREHRAYKALAKRIGLDDAGKKWRAARLVAGYAS